MVPKLIQGGSYFVVSSWRKTVADTTSNVLEQIATRFLVTVTKAVIEADRSRGLDVEGSWQTTKRDSPTPSNN
jgi:hypothetical protein